MVNAPKLTWYYIGGTFFLIGTFIGLSSEGNRKWVSLLWGAVSILIFFLAYKKNALYKKQKATEESIFDKLQNFYKSVLEGNDLSKTGEIVSEISETENVPEPQIKEICRAVVQSLIDNTVSKEAANGSLSPEGLEGILSVAKKLNVDLNFDTGPIGAITKLRHYWDLENAELPIVSVSISLQKDELCYYQNACRWLEHRTVTKAVSYTGITGSFKIAKGVRYSRSYKTETHNSGHTCRNRLWQFIPDQ